MKKNTSKDFNESLISYEEDSDHGSLSVNPFDKEIKLLDLPLQEWATYKTNINSASKNSINEYAILQTPINQQNNDHFFHQQLQEITKKISDGNMEWKNEEKQQELPREIIETSQEGKKRNTDAFQKKNNRRSKLLQISKAGQIKEKIQSQGKKVQQTKSTRCKCKKSKCLKQYCDCFRANKTCKGCNCLNCHNTEEFKEERNLAILELSDKNPNAFKPKLEEQKHTKGCHCKKSSCRKKYCECYQAGISCGVNCRCFSCENYKQQNFFNKINIEKERELIQNLKRKVN